MCTIISQVTAWDISPFLGLGINMGRVELEFRLCLDLAGLACGLDGCLDGCLDNHFIGP